MNNKKTLINGVLYIKYSCLIAIISNILPFILLPLFWFFMHSSGPQKVVSGFFIIFFAIMKITQFIFLLNGFKELTKTKNEQISTLLKKWNRPLFIFFILFGVMTYIPNLGQYLLLSIIALAFLIIKLLTIKILTMDFLSDSKNQWIQTYTWFLIILETVSLLTFLFYDQAIAINYANIDFKLSTLLTSITSFYLLMKTNKILKQQRIS